jgi:hypothetical protein
LFAAIVVATGCTSPSGGGETPQGGHSRTTIQRASDDPGSVTPALTLHCSLSRTRSATRTRALVATHGRPVACVLPGQPGAAFSVSARFAELAPAAHLRSLFSSAPRSSRGPPTA